ncbi:MAG: 50S ribosomal protein L21 [Candidatus Niyogibacteria bacterium CG10_big_fil_rev_8_21_14_0_10_42_19]|uniref:Large ribosomal subunit protein bL21 n=1 Tax=Candidatus Niyogibacteria bacterium CG10_big_fil_rev_8_21_14_0_10_42_19 TaxID=1974725 RepID=A0A2H0TFT4_9BACT|nr:MAG: 50S ribosomal protein L21 [Candidatus Niyogibacteria bacterium CG10_big_fil_rev_8_21_14_0_10_42_19]
MNFAVLETGGKQYIVEPGKSIKIEKIIKPKKGDTVEFADILLIKDDSTLKIGTPYVKGAKVTGEIKREGRSKKITVLRYHSKTRYHKKKGHRQIFTEVVIKDIKVAK